LPVPAPHTLAGSERTPFRTSVNAETPAGIAAVVAFYRSELGKRGWAEQVGKTSVRDDAAELIFDSPTGPATLMLTRDGANTTAQLTVRDKAAAMKSTLWPKPGQVKVAFGNMTDKAVEVSVAGKRVKIAAEAGRGAPNGPTLDLAPGKYDLALRSGEHEAIEAGPEEIWIAMVGPGGLLAVQAYYPAGTGADIDCATPRLTLSPLRAKEGRIRKHCATSIACPGLIRPANAR
jgi:hypothetical protein